MSDFYMDCIDAASLRAILDLLKEDAEEVTASRKGKGRWDSVPTDNEVAFATFTEDVATLDHIATDRLLAESIAQAVDLDALEIARILEEEGRLRTDHHLAQQLDGRDDNELPAVLPTIPTIDPILAPSLPDIGAASSSSSSLLPTETSCFSIHQIHQHQAASYFASLRTECAACLTPVFNHTKFVCPCGDSYCKPCLRQMFVNATKEESAYPPRCCKIEIPPTQVLDVGFGVLNANEIKNFQASAEEFGSITRVYCHDKLCGKFIPKKHVEFQYERGTCVTCKKTTCIHCGKKEHNGECPDDQDLTSVLDLGKQKGWKRCEICKRMVEKTHGCEHISCTCGHHFCYRCGKKWTGNGHTCA